MGVKETLAKVQQQIPEGETYQGAFIGTSNPPFWWHLLLGSLAHLLAKTYIIGISDKKLYFARQNMLGNVESLDGFEDFEIRQLTIKENMMSSYTFSFEFSNGRKLKLKIFSQKSAKSECHLTIELLALLKERFKCL